MGFTFRLVPNRRGLGTPGVGGASFPALASELAWDLLWSTDDRARSKVRLQKTLLSFRFSLEPRAPRKPRKQE